MFRFSVVAVMVFTAVSLAQAQEPAPSQPPAPANLVASRIILRVANLQKSVVFYRDLVGLKVTSTFEEFAVLNGGAGVTVMLQQISTGSLQPSSGLAAMTEVVFESPDILASYHAMKARGVAFRIEPRVVTNDGGGRDFYAVDFRDPDGHVLSLGGWLPNQK
jgi:catechol 2,3-dioxygenase-like lactoylglutathione lyase family enzyme